MAASVTSTPYDYWVLLKPSVMSLVIFTALCGIFLAPGQLHPVQALIGLLAIAVGAGGSGALNMWYERDIDAKMSRTQKRPIPKQKIEAGNALAFGMVLSLGSVFLLAFATNYYAAALLAFTIFFYGVVYTIWLKPRTPQNIVIGGAAGALPPVIGWVMVSQDFSWLPTLMFFIIFLWTPAHFWALALYRVDDYGKAKIPMLPSVVGRKKTCEQIFFYTLLTVIISLIPFFMEFFSAFYLIITAGAGLYFIRLSWYVWKKDMRQAGRLFGYSILYLFVVFLAMILDRWLF